MAQIGYGYGSEYQLMRFLGHHRDDLYKLIRAATHTCEPIEWRDYPYENERISGDGELKGVECFSKLKNYAEIKIAWKKFWPQRGESMNWDGIFTIGDTWYFVEAKAHKEESYQKCGAKNEHSINTIKKAFNDTQIEMFNVDPPHPWIETNCYQLANRLAFLYFCNNKCDINAKLFYIGFINGFRIKAGNEYVGAEGEVHSKKDWMEVWNKELKELGLDWKDVSPYIVFIYPDCDPNRKK